MNNLGKAENRENKGSSVKGWTEPKKLDAFWLSLY